MSGAPRLRRCTHVRDSGGFSTRSVEGLAVLVHFQEPLRPLALERARHLLEARLQRGAAHPLMSNGRKGRDRPLDDSHFCVALLDDVI